MQSTGREKGKRKESETSIVGNVRVAVAGKATGKTELEKEKKKESEEKKNTIAALARQAGRQTGR